MSERERGLCNSSIGHRAGTRRYSGQEISMVLGTLSVDSGSTASGQLYNRLEYHYKTHQHQHWSWPRTSHSRCWPTADSPDERHADSVFTARDNSLPLTISSHRELLHESPHERLFVRRPRNSRRFSAFVGHTWPSRTAGCQPPRARNRLRPPRFRFKRFCPHEKIDYETKGFSVPLTLIVDHYMNTGSVGTSPVDTFFSIG